MTQNFIEEIIVVESVLVRKKLPAQLSGRPEMLLPSKAATITVNLTVTGRVRFNISKSEHLLTHRESSSG